MEMRLAAKWRTSARLDLDCTRALLRQQHRGAGATFPYPIYSKWFDVYAKENPGIKFNYQSIGSGGGIRMLSNRTVDVGASDAPLTDAQLGDAPGKILHFPSVMGAVVIAYNIPGFTGTMRLTGAVIADIFAGK